VLHFFQLGYFSFNCVFTLQIQTLLASNQVKNPTKTLNSREYTNRKDHKSKAKDPTCKAANIIHGELERARYSEIIAPFSISCNYNLHAFFSVSSFDITLFFFS